MTEYSFLQSVIRIDDLINFALTNKLDQLVITDRNNMHGVAEFISKCKINKIKPIVGIDIDIDNYRMILLAKNYQGYLDLMNLASKKAKNSLTFDNLNLLNIVAIDHPTEGYFAQTGLKISAPNYYIGTFDPTKDGVYFQETRALKEEDKITLQILDKLRLGDNNTINYNNFQEYQVSLLDSVAVQNSTKILESCSLEFPKLTNFIPKYKSPPTFTSITFLKKLVHDALIEKKLSWQEESIYTERLWHEIKIIENLQFENYFLVLWDLVKYALTQNILIGPGRGSAAGSLVAYLLKITEIDPIKHNLLFERFLNPERVSLPDIDIDIQDDRRIEIINYLFVKYSKENVALISTFQRLGSKSAIRDVARLKGISIGEAIEITKLIPTNATLEQTYQKSSKFRAIVTKSQIIKEVFELAQKIENLPRQLGTHAAGVVISNIKIENKSPTLNSSDGFNQIQFSMDHLEDIGLLKIDLLGLRNLTILQHIKSEVLKNYKKEIIWTKIPLNDKKTYDLLSEGRTNGIFQFESLEWKEH